MPSIGQTLPEARREGIPRSLQGAVSWKTEQAEEGGEGMAVCICVYVLHTEDDGFVC